LAELVEFSVDFHITHLKRTILLTTLDGNSMDLKRVEKNRRVYHLESAFRLTKNNGNHSLLVVTSLNRDSGWKESMNPATARLRT